MHQQLPLEQLDLATLVLVHTVDLQFVYDVESKEGEHVGIHLDPAGGTVVSKYGNIVKFVIVEQ